MANCSYGILFGRELKKFNLILMFSINFNYNLLSSPGDGMCRQMNKHNFYNL